MAVQNASPTRRKPRQSGGHRMNGKVSWSSSNYFTGVCSRTKAPEGWRTPRR
jgi:hypothetical protein